MTSRRLFIGSMCALAAVPLLSSGQSCCAAGGAGKKAACADGAAKLKATNAAVVACDGAKTKIKITCAKCGKDAELEIDTPTADKPYSLDWTCPKCGKKQTVTVEVAKPE